MASEIFFVSPADHASFARHAGRDDSRLRSFEPVRCHGNSSADNLDFRHAVAGAFCAEEKKIFTKLYVVMAIVVTLPKFI